MQAVKKLIFISIFFITIISVYCLSQFDTTSVKSPYYNKSDHSLCKDYSQAELNYLYYIENDNNEYSVYFPFDISEINFSNSNLYYNDELITNDFEVIEVYTDHIILKLNTYIEKFNNLSVSINSKDIHLYTGKHLFTHITDIEEHSSYVSEYHDTVGDTILQADFSVTPFVSNIKPYISQQAISDGFILENTLVINSSKRYYYTLKPDISKLRELGITRFSIDLIFMSENANNTKAKLFSSNIPFNITP